MTDEEIEKLIAWHEAEAARIAERNIPNVNLDKHQRSALALRHLLSERPRWRPIEEAERRLNKRYVVWLSDEDTWTEAMWKTTDEGEMWWLPSMDIYQTDEGFHIITLFLDFALPPSPKDQDQ